jgi:hypothetical protein
MKRGFSTIELLIAMAIAILTLSAVLTVIGGGASGISDGEINSEALRKAQVIVEEAVSHSKSDYLGVTATSSTECSGALCYTNTLEIPVAYATECQETIVGTVSWTGSYGRNLSVYASTIIVDIPGMLALGGDCSISPPISGWNPPMVYAADDFSPGKPTSMDVANKIAYIGGDKEPFIYVADARSAALSSWPTQCCELGDAYANNFNFNGKVLDEVHDIDVASTTSKVYAYVATASTTAPFVVLDMTDIKNPAIASQAGVLAKRGLSGISAEGWRLYYFDNRVYVVSKVQAAGGELHIFDVSNPANPTQIGTPYELNTTVSDLAVTKKKDSSGVSHLIAYLAAGEDTSSSELIALDVTNAASITALSGATRNFSGTEPGLSVHIVGNRLYFGRADNSGAEFYALDASDPFNASGGLPISASQEIGHDVTAIRVVGRFAFIAVDHSNEEVQVWPSDFSGTYVSIYNFGNQVRGLDFEDEWMFVASLATPSFQILYSSGYSISNGGAISVEQGQSGNTTVTQTLVTGTASPGTLSASGLPAGASATFANNGCTPTCTSTVTITTSYPTTPIGTHPITIISTLGLVTNFNLVVTAQPLDYSFNSPAAITVAQGAQASTTVTSTLVSGTPTGVSISVSGLPTGATATYNNNACTPGCSVQVGIQTSASTPAGTYPITVTGSPNGTSNPSTTFNLVVTPVPFDYSISVSPSSISVPRNTTGTVVVTLTQISGTAQPVSISMTNFPNNVTYAPNPGSCTPNPTCSVTFTITSPNNAQKVTRTVTVTGTSPTHTTTFTVTVP